MKTIYLILCFTCLGFWTGLAQAADTNNYGQALREALQRAERRMTNASGGDVPSVPSQPAKENSNAPAAPPAHTVPVPSPKAVIPPAASTSPANANANPAGVPSLPSFPKPAPANMSSVPQPGARPPVASQTAKPAPAASAESEEMVPAGIINFSGVDLAQVLDIYAQYVNRTILRPANLPAPLITLKTQTALTRQQVVQALDAVLALNGIAMINVGDKFVKAVPVAQAGQEAGAFSKEKAANLPDLGQYVTHVVQLKYAKPSELVPALQPFAKAPNAILAIDSSQILVLRDYAENVKRMLQMVDKIDVATPAEFVSEVIPIKYAMASDIADALNSLSTGGGVTSVGGGSSSGNRTPMGGGMMNSRRGYGGAFGNTMNSGMNMRPQSTTPPQSSFTQRLKSIMNRAGVGGKDEIQILGPTKIIADQRSNSLLVFATQEDMKMITNIVAKLDVLLPQVLIESIIMDVSLNNGLNFGVSAAQNPKTFSPHGPTVGAGGFNNGQPFVNFLSQSATNVISIGTNAASGLANALPGGFSYFANLGPSWDVALQAAANDSDVTIIQRPRIQTSQAKEAQFFVGQTVPYVSQVYYSGLGTGPSSSYQQMQVGIQLDVTPFINPNGLVVMDINQEIDDLSGYTVIQGVGNVPNTVKRSLSSEIAVRDRDTIILGGFIRNENSKNRSGVPLLQDIPILGNLFSSRSNSKAREELVVLMRPTVLKTPEIAAAQVAKEEQRLPGIHRARVEEEMYERDQMKKEQAELRRQMGGQKSLSAEPMTPGQTDSPQQH